MDGINSSYEKQIAEWAAGFDYPPTPNIAGKIRPLLTASPKKPIQTTRRLAWALALLLLAASLLAVPSVRAALVQILRAGGIIIFVGEEAAVDEIPPLLSEQLPAFTEPIALADAVTRFPNLQLPTELPPPDDVLLHEEPVWDTAVIFLWRGAADPQQIGLSLYQIQVPDYAYKGSEMLEMTAVNGNQAFWLVGSHYFRLQDSALAAGAVEEWLFVEGSVLIWWEDDVTYRLEGAMSLEDALRIAESLEEIEQ
ncbi:hypothetical protein [Candidatus Leptofilum sp.]|uniref:hypothetical protein n=1 Tax=Candidatus Leptofilum sp. TaxID=3241576 RepID=UPI003B5BC880